MVKATIHRSLGDVSDTKGPVHTHRLGSDPLPRAVHLTPASAPSRRAVLLTGLGLVAAGCALLPHRETPNAASLACASVPVLPIDVPLGTQAEAARFAAFDPLVDPLSAADVRTGAKALWRVQGMPPFWRPYWYAPLDAAVRRGNFDAGAMLPGAATAFQYEAQTYALPAWVAPLAVAYRPDVFSAALLPPPSPDWTVADFEKACARITDLAKAGKLPNCTGALAGGSLIQSAWYAFALGYGGVIARNGRFDLTNDGAVQGFLRVTQLDRAYSAPYKSPPKNQADVQAHLRSVAMLLVPFTGATSVPGGRHVARFPRLPARPVVPATLSGWGLTFQQQAGQPIPAVSNAATDALVQFCLWSYQRLRQAPAAATLPPVLADPNVQRVYWQAPVQVQVGADALADYGDYVYEGADLPQTGDRFDGSLLARNLSAVVAGSRGLTAALTDAQQQLNDLAARFAVDKAMRSQEDANLAAAQQTFGVGVATSPLGPLRRVCAPGTSG